MLTPSYLAGAPDRMVELYGAVERDILANMAERIAKYDYYIPAAQHQHQKLRAMGMLESDIEAELAKLTGKSKAEIKGLMTEAVEKSLTEDAKIYAAAGRGKVDPFAVAGVNDVLRAGMTQTAGIFRNLTRTTANTASKQFEDALDRAWLQITSGGFDYNTAVRNAVKDLSRSGVKAITYPSNHVDSLEVAVRRAIVTGVNQTAAKSQIALMDELGATLVEVTAHSGARPSHAEWQGKIFCRKGKHPKYKNFEEATGYGTGDGLCGWNCSHSFYPYFEGAPRTYSDKQLKEYNAEKYKYNGKELTEYEAMQQQRYIERQIRRWKREEAAMAAAGQPTGEASSKVAAWQARQRDFTKQTGLKRDYSREQIGKATAFSGFTNPAKQNIIKTVTEKVEPPVPKAPALSWRDRRAAEKELSSTASAWQKNLSKAEREKLWYYTGDGYTYINEYLRGLSDEDSMLSVCKSIDASLAQFSLNQDISVIRGMSSGTLRRYGISLDDSAVGKQFSDPAYMSTTVNRLTADHFAADAIEDTPHKAVLVQLDIPAGAGRGAYLEGLTENPGEYEFLVKRNAKFEVYEVTKDLGTTLLKMRWIE